MISRRTGVLLLIVIVLTIALGRVLLARQYRCAQTRQTFSRRAPIAAASGTNTFVCLAMAKGMPMGDNVLAVVWAIGLLALVRSALIDREARRRRKLRGPDDWE